MILFLRRWASFIRERFSPESHLVMVTVFYLGNVAFGILPSGTCGFTNIIDSDRFLIPHALSVRLTLGWLLTLCIFFRLRIFDELKDAISDRTAHPDRPLAAGRISLSEARAVAAGVALIEGLLVVLMAWDLVGSLVAWGLVVGFSLLMYREFFAGSWLRPRMELYALSHTAVAVLIGALVAGVLGPTRPWTGNYHTWLLCGTNWFMFNLFEFARKTYAPAEEQPGVPSYSARLGPWWVSALIIEQGLLAVLVSCTLLGPTAIALAVPLMVLVCMSWIYAVAPTSRSARRFRNWAEIFLVLYYLLWGAVFMPVWFYWLPCSKDLLRWLSN